jgi:acetoin utilization deacetylase AcuC-like enzyme
VNPDSPAIARLAAGATVDLTRAVMQGTIDRGIALVRPPGHHATERRSMGFCLFNNAALAAQWALDDGGARRVAILDIDVHHGNGTQDIFWNDPRVLYISTHQFPFYPGTGNWNEVGGPDAQGANVNIPLPAWAGERAFDLAFERVVLSALARFAPDLLLISVGFDAYWRDPLAQLQLTPAGYRRCVDEAIAACASTTGGKTVVVLEGGYDLEGIGRCAANVTLGLLDDEKQVDDVPDQALRDEPDVRRVVDQVRSVHGLNG